MKTVADYMNDPRITGDPDMMTAMEPIREIHAIRLKLQDETAGMTAVEEADYFNKKAVAAFARNGITSRLVNLSGHGRIHGPVTQ